MKKKTFIFLLSSILMMSAAIAFAGCKRGNGLSDGESLPSAEEIDETGALLVVREDGTREAITSGEVSVRDIYGYV